MSTDPIFVCEGLVSESMVSDGLPGGTGGGGFLDDGDGASRAAVRGIPSRNVVIDGRRTSIRLDAISFEALIEIAEIESVTVNKLCTLINERIQGSDVTFSSAVRMFLLSYYRAAASKAGHKHAGHGEGQPLAGIPFERFGALALSPAALNGKKERRSPGGDRLVSPSDSKPAAS